MRQPVLTLGKLRHREALTFGCLSGRPRLTRGSSAGVPADHGRVLASTLRCRCVLFPERNSLQKRNYALALCQCRVWASVAPITGTCCLQAT